MTSGPPFKPVPFFSDTEEARSRTPGVHSRSRMVTQASKVFTDMPRNLYEFSRCDKQRVELKDVNQLELDPLFPF